MGSAVRFRLFRSGDLSAVKKLVDRTIGLSYADHYCKRAIGFFKEHHAADRITKDAAAGYTVVLTRGGRIVGTGTLLDGEIRRMFVDPACQHQGLGKRIMHQLLRRAKLGRCRKVVLHSSLPAKRFYESFGFTVVKSGSVSIGGRGRLKYYEMALLVETPTGP